jgi:hypothetical protein
MKASQRPDPSLPGGVWVFIAAVLGLGVFRFLLGLVRVGEAWVIPLNVLLAVLFLGIPILALFFGANHKWGPRLALGFVIGGALLQWLGVEFRDMTGIAGGVLNAFGQAGLQFWTVGLGALLATLIKDKNILVPIAIFLAIFDVFLVLTPMGITQQIMQKAPEALPSVAAQVPALGTNQPTGKALTAAYVGPADLVFLGCFFVALFRFRMQTRLTFKLVVPALLVYLAVVLSTGWPLPALVPIGLCLLVANWREFQLSKDEKISTAVVAALGLALLIWSATRPRPMPEPPAELSNSVGAPGPGESGGLLDSTSGDQPRSESPSAPESTPGPR